MKSQYFNPQILSQLPSLEFKAKYIVEGLLSGLHRSPYFGFNVEFSEYRAYTPGDDIKFIDWKVYAKSDKFYIRQFEEETNMRVYVLLDASASMNFTSHGMTKWQYACLLSATFSYLLLRQQDSVSFFLFNKTIQKNLPPRNAMSQFKNITTLLENTKPDAETTIVQTLHTLAERVKKRSVFVLVSDLFDDREKVILGLKHLHHRKHEVLVFHVVDRAEENLPYDSMTAFVDAETKEKISVMPSVVRAQYKKAFEDMIYFYKQQCFTMGMDYKMFHTQNPLTEEILSYLSSRTTKR